ncbi:MAG TPA: NifU family protein [Candidatus Angelobacter sp.]|nr:NifU family protein [Candidatus Angelobacter sp.]
MPEDDEFRQRVHRISHLAGEVDSIADPKTRHATKELVQLLMEFHGAGLERILEIVHQGGNAGERTIHTLGVDPLVSSLLVLYGLHPDDLATRVQKAVEKAQANLKRQGATMSLLSLDAGAVRILLQPGEHTCSSSTDSLRTVVEEAIYEAAPDIASLSIEGLERQSASGFVPLEQLLGNASSAPPAPPSTTTNDFLPTQTARS